MKPTRNNLIVAALLGVAVATAAWSLRSNAQPQQPRGPVLTRYEYGRLVFGQGPAVFHQAERRTELPAPLNSPTGVERRQEPTGQRYGQRSVETRDTLSGALDTLGQEGWEAYSVTNDNTRTVVHLRRKY